MPDQATFYTMSLNNAVEVYQVHSQSVIDSDNLVWLNSFIVLFLVFNGKGSLWGCLLAVNETQSATFSPAYL